jgi:copper(I)-binding protein
MFKLVSLLLFMLGALLAACGPNQPDITISDAWGRPSIKSAANGAFYMAIHNEGRSEDRLVAASTNLCRSIELHQTSVDGQDVMMMRQVDEVAIPAGQTIVLKVGGLHIMCLDRREEFVIGDRIPLTLTFEISGEMVISAEIRP